MKALTVKEEEIMGWFWQKGPLFVKEMQALYDEPRPHFNTLSTMVRLLESIFVPQSGKPAPSDSVGLQHPRGEAQPMSGVSPSLDAEAIRVLSSMPKWKPGKHSGVAVNVRYSMPVMFRLQKATKK